VQGYCGHWGYYSEWDCECFLSLNCEELCGCDSGNGGVGGGGGVLPGSGPLSPNVIGGKCYCLAGDPKILAISGTGGKPGNYVHALLQSGQTGFQVKYPEKDTAENLIAADGSWTVTLRLDSNTKNVNKIDPGTYYATFSDADAQGAQRASSLNRQWIEVLSCEKNELKFDISGGAAVSCAGGSLTFTGSGASPFAEINIYLSRTGTSQTAYWYGDTANADGVWSTSIYLTQLGSIFGVPSCVPTGDYTVFAFQTSYEGFMRESQDVPITISGCCGTRAARGTTGKARLGNVDSLPERVKKVLV
jgi:hypothetical protein